MSLSGMPGNDNFSYNNLSRREIRSLIFHLLYAAEAFDYTVQAEQIAENFNKWMDLDIPLDCEALSIASAVIKDRQELDRIIEPLLDNWRLERIGVCTKLVLRLSLWEIRDTDTPSSIIINEAIELAKCFSEKDAYRFVNGILDEACKKYRKDEPVLPVENSNGKAFGKSGGQEGPERGEEGEGEDEQVGREEQDFEDQD